MLISLSLWVSPISKWWKYVLNYEGGNLESFRKDQNEVCFIEEIRKLKTLVIFMNFVIYTSINKPLIK